MFVKIKVWNVKKTEAMGVIYGDLERETLYDAVSIDSVPIPPDEGEKTGRMLFTLKLSNGVEEHIYVPWEDDNKVVEIYCENNQGKTIDTYIY